MAQSKRWIGIKPINRLYPAYILLFDLFKFLYLSICYLSPSLRPIPSWTYRFALNNELIKMIFEYWSITKVEQPLITQGSRGEDIFVTLNPADPDLYRGALAASSTVRPVPISGVWHPRCPSPLPLKRKEKEWEDLSEESEEGKGEEDSASSFVILHFHGGAYVFFSPDDPNVHEGLVALQSSLPGVSAVFAPEYRLASSSSSRQQQHEYTGYHFPAQLQDAVSAYAYLVNELGWPASRIILSGDSAGGNIVVGLLRYLHEQEKAIPLPKPAAALLHSPWLNLSPNACRVEESALSRSDFLSTAYLEWGAQSVASAATAGAEDRRGKWISPLFHPFKCEVPIWVQDGTVEVLHPDILDWVEKMRSRQSRVEYYGAENMVHNLLIIVKFMGVHEDRARALSSAEKFLRTLS